ncbi:transfer/carrier protein [Lithospermum erythrorhizon]|uniref:Transfer/carrier protein n=1 Tax=Lithospermum erythrorhizon TaxID=34254 RepID=A0AAV3QSG1_LITER
MEVVVGVSVVGIVEEEVPPLFNITKSSIQADGESVYYTNVDMLRKYANGETAFDRFKYVIGWSLSTTRPLIFGVIPYNSILGETHHASRDGLNVLLEQVSHHPPVTALHATNEKENIESIWCLSPKAKFYGNF